MLWSYPFLQILLPVGPVASPAAKLLLQDHDAVQLLRAVRSIPSAETVVLFPGPVGSDCKPATAMFPAADCAPLSSTSKTSAWVAKIVYGFRPAGTVNLFFFAFQIVARLTNRKTKYAELL